MPAGTTTTLGALILQMGALILQTLHKILFHICAIFVHEGPNSSIYPDLSCACVT